MKTFFYIFIGFLLTSGSSAGEQVSSNFLKDCIEVGGLHVPYRVDVKWVSLPLPDHGPPADDVLLEMVRKGKGQVLASAEVLVHNGVQAFTTVQLETYGPDLIEVDTTVSLLVIPLSKDEGIVQINFFFEADAKVFGGREAKQLQRDFQGESEILLTREEHGNELHVTVAGLRLHISGDTE